MSEFLSYENVGVSETTVWQSEQRRILFQIKRVEVSSCELHWGSPEEWPAGSLLLGLALLLPAYLPLRHLWAYLHEPDVAGVHLGSLRYELAVLVFVGIGVWLVYQAAVKRNYYLRVFSAGRTRKLVFSSRVTRAEIMQFLDDARTRFGLEYTDRTEAPRPNGAG